MAFDPQNIIGKTVNAYISRPGPGKTRVFMMMFTDGSCCEFVTGKNEAFSCGRKGLKSPSGTANGRITDLIDTDFKPATRPIQQMALSGF